MDQPDIQQIFFREIKANLPPHLSLVDTIAEIINISNDSAYRRIRGEKPLSFEEIKILSSHFQVSLDKIFHLNNNSFLFSGQLTDKDSFGVDFYLENLLNQLNYFNTFERRELYYIAKDIFIFHCFGFHELTAFKIFFWMKTVYEYPFKTNDMFVMESLQEAVYKMASKLTESYKKVPSVEIWTEDSINSTIRQIEYYRQSKVFPSDDYALKVFNSLLEMIDHIEKQAEAGYKFSVGEKSSAAGAPYRFFVNEFFLGDNCNMVVLDNTKVVYLNHTFLNVLMTRDPVFTEYAYQYTQKIMRKSTLMSNAGEKERTRFFNTMRDKIHVRMKQI
jgi:hypothetical protein